MAQRKRWHYIKFWTVCSVKRDAHKSENEIFSCLFAHCLTTAYPPICNLQHTKLCRNWTAAKAYTFFLVFLFSHDVQTWEFKLKILCLMHLILFFTMTVKHKNHNAHWVSKYNLAAVYYSKSIPRGVVTQNLAQVSKTAWQLASGLGGDLHKFW